VKSQNPDPLTVITEIEKRISALLQEIEELESHNPKLVRDTGTKNLSTQQS
jgi:uncharacterized small protein (DUF1192 family)